MKKSILILPALALALAACGGDDVLPSSSLSQSAGESQSLPVESGSSSSHQEEKTYIITLTLPAGVEAELDKEEAKEGEAVTLTILSTDPGFKVTGAKANEEELVSTDGNKTFSFTMPGRSVRVTVQVEVEGTVTLSGDIAAILTLEENDVYAARNVKVDVPQARANFSYNVEGEGGSLTKIPAYSLDESRSFADISFNFGTEENLNIASGSTYDFFYDPSSPLFPCYVQRVKVDQLPNSEASLSSLFNTGLSIRSETAIHPADVQGMTLSLTIPGEGLAQELEMNRYEDGSFLFVAEDLLQARDYHVYKRLDEEAGTLTVVDEYTHALGNNDLTRERENAYSATYDVVEDSLEESEDLETFEISHRLARKSLETFPYAMKLLEGEIMDAYRSGFQMEETSSYSVRIESEPQEEGFLTTVDTYVEYSSEGGTYAEEMHEGHVFHMEIGFTEGGAIKSLDYLETIYSETEWDFVGHAPLAGQSGKVGKRMEGEWRYGDPLEGEAPFDLSPYFIEEFEEIRFYNPDSGVEDDGETSAVHYGDKIRLASYFEEEEIENVEASYLPRTALDLWQYGPVSSSDETKIGKSDTDDYTEMTALGLTDETGVEVTIGRATKDPGATYTLPIRVWATTKFHALALDWTASDMVQDIDKARIYENTTESYLVNQVPDNAPCVFEAESENPSLLEVVSTEGGRLTLKAGAVEKPTEVRIACTSDWYDPPAGEGNAVVFTITILPQDMTPVGTSWTVTMDPVGYPDTHIVFTEEPYEGGDDSYENPLKGYIVDTYIESADEENPEETHEDVYWFYYEYVDGGIRASVYETNVTDTGIAADEYRLAFEYDPADGEIGVCLSYGIADEASYGMEFGAVIGTVDAEDGTPTVYIPFVQDETYTEYL